MSAFLCEKRQCPRQKKERRNRTMKNVQDRWRRGDGGRCRRRGKCESCASFGPTFRRNSQRTFIKFGSALSVKPTTTPHTAAVSQQKAVAYKKVLGSWAGTVRLWASATPARALQRGAEELPTLLHRLLHNWKAFYKPFQKFDLLVTKKIGGCHFSLRWVILDHSIISSLQSGERSNMLCIGNRINVINKICYQMQNNFVY